MSRPTEHLNAAAQRVLAVLPAAPAYRVALSGGADSAALLRLLAGRVPLRAIHVDHALGPQAEPLRQAAERLAAALGVPLVCLPLEAAPPAGNLEEWARTGRYALFAKVLRAGEVLLTAHHQQDQAESLLLAAARGSGVRGLQAMRPLQRLGHGWLARPLLGWTREELRCYAGEEGRDWVEDASNADLRFDRNRLRQQVLPALQSWRADALPGLAHAAELAAQATQVQDSLAAALAAQIAGPAPHSWQLAPILNLPDAVWPVLLRVLCRQAAAPSPPARALRQFRRQLGAAGSDAQPVLAWSGWSLRRHRGLLYLLPPLPAPPPAPLPLLDSATGSGAWWAGGRVRWQLPARPLAQIRLGSGRMHARVQLSDGRRLRVDETFRQRGIPPWVRQCWPQLHAAEALLAVAQWPCATAHLHWESPPIWARHWVLPAAGRDVAGDGLLELRKPSD